MNPTTAEDPTIVDVAVAALRSHDKVDEDTGPALDILSWIVRQQNADAAFRENTVWSMLHHSEAENRLLRDGIGAALRDCEFGGTTADYERTLRRIQAVIDASYGGPILDWYVKQEDERLDNGGAVGTPAATRCHPAYEERGWT